MVDYGGSQNLPLPPRIYPPFFCDYVKCIRLPESTPPFQNIPPFQQLYATIPETNLPSQNIPPFQHFNIMQPSQHLYLPPRIYPAFQQFYATLPESTPPPQNIPPFQQLYATLPESTHPSQNIPPFSTTTIVCDPPRIYPSLPEYTPLFNNYMRPSQNLPLSPRIYFPFQQRQYYATPLPPQNLPTTIILSNPPRIYSSLPEYTPFSTNLYVRPSQNLPLPPRIYPHPLHIVVERGRGIYSEKEGGI